ncbi:MAG: excinuclease ABC subunit UvrC [Nitrospirae bacterium]|nr:MAG: excinuclease ABC subunit UvrC [Nitrospirota bacterium]
MRRCPAPCAGRITRNEYMSNVREVEAFLRGKKEELIKDLEQRMLQLSEELRFEEAARIRDRLTAIRRAFDSQKVVAPELGNMDIIGIHQHEAHSMVNILTIRNGLLIGKKDFFLKNTTSSELSELLSEVIKFYYSKDMLYPKRIILSTQPEDRGTLQEWLRQRAGHRVSIAVARKSIEKKLLKMAQKNAEETLKVQLESPYRKTLEELKLRLSLKRTPYSIGAFDVSTTFGTHSVGAFVWWEGGDFQRDNYRHIRIKTVEGIDDYSMMEETIKRVFKSLEGLPDLVIIDGGRAHLEVALRAMDELLDKETEIDIIAVAKSPDRAILREGGEIMLDDGGPASLLLIAIRDEVHRFALSFHRKIRGKEFLESPLERVKGIGKKRRLALLKHFGSIDAIRKATVEEIASVKGMNRKIAERLKKSLQTL